MNAMLCLRDQSVYNSYFFLRNAMYFNFTRYCLLSLFCPVFSLEAKVLWDLQLINRVLQSFWLLLKIKLKAE
jgi:hypothetical protein